MLSLLTNLHTIVNQYLDRLQSIRPGGKAYDDALRAGVEEALASSRERIHSRGEASDGSAIGQYSTRPVYVRDAAAGEPAGKNGKRIFADGRQHLLRYFAGGYKEYKSALGHDAGSVNLTLTGAMRDSYQVVKTPDGYGLGWDDQDMAARATALEEKYGKKIWDLTEDEKRNLTTTVRNKLDPK